MKSNNCIKQEIKERALAIGFDKVGCAPARLPAEDIHLKEWLAQNYHGEMHWLNRDPSRRTNMSNHLDSANTVICCALNYYQGPPVPLDPGQGVISSYAQGTDYHQVLDTKLRKLASFIEDRYEVPTRIYVDTGPVLEKPYSVAAGLGWLGKHSNLISRDGSSWFFLGEILVPLELSADIPENDHCGTCTRCIEVCPTQAIVEPYVVDSRLCISYLTIELNDFIPRELRASIGNRIYGCDDCQDVCPWNRFAKKSAEAAFFAREPLASMDLVAMLKITHKEFLAATHKSAIRRARYPGFLRNVAIALGNSKDRTVVPALLETLNHKEPLVRGHVAWALGELRDSRAIEPLISRLQIEIHKQVRNELEWARQALLEDR